MRQLRHAHGRVERKGDLPGADFISDGEPMIPWQEIQIRRKAVNRGVMDARLDALTGQGRHEIGPPASISQKHRKEMVRRAFRRPQEWNFKELRVF